MRPNEFAKKHGVSRQAVDFAVKAGRILHTRNGRSVDIPEDVEWQSRGWGNRRCKTVLFKVNDEEYAAIVEGSKRHGIKVSAYVRGRISGAL